MTCINVDGIHWIEVIEKIGKHFNAHPLILEDISRLSVSIVMSSMQKNYLIASTIYDARIIWTQIMRTN